MEKDGHLGTKSASSLNSHDIGNELLSSFYRQEARQPGDGLVRCIQKRTIIYIALPGAEHLLELKFSINKMVFRMSN